MISARCPQGCDYASTNFSFRQFLDSPRRYFRPWHTARNTRSLGRLTPVSESYRLRATNPLRESSITVFSFVFSGTYLCEPLRVRAALGWTTPEPTSLIVNSKYLFRERTIDSSIRKDFFFPSNNCLARATKRTDCRAYTRSSRSKFRGSYRRERIEERVKLENAAV